MSTIEWIGTILGLGLMLGCNVLPKAWQEYSMLVFIAGVVLVIISGLCLDSPKKKKGPKNG